jgi:serine/threonine protein kinase
MNDALGQTILAHDTGAAATMAVPSTSAPSSAAVSRTTTLARASVLPRKAASTHEPERGERFEPLKPLGEGGMGEVLLVQDHDIGRKVAVKRLRADQTSEAALLRFAEEVRTVGRLEHPGIVPVHDVGVDQEGAHYLVMKYVEGETLETVIEKLKGGSAEHRTLYTLEYRAQVCLALLQALRYAHDKGVIHRDLKPANVMVGKFGEVMLMDWGIAKQVERGAKEDVGPRDLPTLPHERLFETQQGALVGTPMYMSPEQALGKVRELDERSDVYSAGLLMLELLTLKHPYAHLQTVPELLVAQARQPFTISQIMGLGAAEAIKAEYVHFLVKALQKDPALRFQSVGEMEHRLQRALSGDVDVQCHVTFAKRSGHALLRWIDRHPNLYTALLFSFLLSFVAGAVALVVRLAT